MKRNLVYGVSSDSWLTDGTAMHEFEVEVADRHVEEVAALMKAEFLRLGREGVSAEDFIRLKESAGSHYRQDLSNLGHRSFHLGLLAMEPEGRADDPPDPVAVFTSLTPPEVNGYVREIFREDNMFVAISRPLLNVWQSTLALIGIVALFLGLVVLAVKWRRRLKRAPAEAAQS